MGFQFPLATVLRYREGIEKQEARALGRIVAELAQVRGRIETLTKEIADARQMLEQAMQQTMPAIDVAIMSDRIDGILQRRQELIESVPELERQRKTQNKRYLAARNSRHMLSDLQDQQRETYALERARAEQKLLDEIYTSRAQRG